MLVQAQDTGRIGPFTFTPTQGLDGVFEGILLLKNNLTSLEYIKFRGEIWSQLSLKSKLSLDYTDHTQWERARDNHLNDPADAMTSFSTSSYTLSLFPPRLANIIKTLDRGSRLNSVKSSLSPSTSAQERDRESGGYDDDDDRDAYDGSLSRRDDHFYDNLGSIKTLNLNLTQYLEKYELYFSNYYHNVKNDNDDERDKYADLYNNGDGGIDLIDADRMFLSTMGNPNNPNNLDLNHLSNSDSLIFSRMITLITP